MAAQDLRSVGLRNWAGNIAFSARQLHEPVSVEELQDVVAASDNLRVLGTGHSFNRIADCDADLVSIANLPPRVEIDEATSTVSVNGAIRYGDLAAQLFQQGFALHNLGSLPHISIAGACATGTHGSGEMNRGLSGAVRAIEMVNADGDIVRLARGRDAVFPGAVVGLGCLGVVTQMTLDIVPTFDIQQFVYDNLPGKQLAEHFDEVVGRAYSVSLFTTWRSRDIDQVWVKHKVDADGPWQAEHRWLEAILADSARHPLPGMPVANCTEQLGVIGPWHERLPHFRLEFVPSAGDELQSEYLLSRQFAGDAFEAVAAIANRIAPVLRICEIRTIASDDLWLSPAYGRETIAFHFTWVKDEPAVAPVIAAIEEALAPFDARPHWGKLFTTSPDVVRGLYPRFGDFEELMRRHDAAGKFRNAFIDRYFSGA